jgi:hypothetical protein
MATTAAIEVTEDHTRQATPLAEHPGLDAAEVTRR